MAHKTYDLAHDPNEVGPDFVVECVISQGPRHTDAMLNPIPVAIVLEGDDEVHRLKARVIRRIGDRVRVGRAARQPPTPSSRAAQARRPGETR